MPRILRITEALDLELDAERWRCNRCGQDLGPARANYKEACLLFDRDPRDIHGRFPGDPEFSFSPHPEWCRIVEIYCPSCGTMLDLEYLPPGHPPSHDIELDFDALKSRLAGNARDGEAADGAVADGKAADVAANPAPSGEMAG